MYIPMQFEDDLLARICDISTGLHEPLALLILIRLLVVRRAEAIQNG